MIELLCIDIDGTMTNGNLYYGIKDSNIFETIKVFNVKDGLGLAYWKHIGRKVAIITGRKSEILRARCEELKIDFIFMGVEDKGTCVRKLKNDLGLDSIACASIGDDMNDIAMFKETSLSFAPNDCANAVRNIVNIVLSKNGGSGVVREMIEIILKKEGLYEKFIEYWQ
ncbi:HAD family hydrolase [Helicobacter sp. MIT 14-3879]|uniref:KdsC family phosphatase n=1 Tax=Helicobacter sp. MIT 14-3879 TaxID=2040649 RepID=UPI000E1F032D|nr:HAD hydrolase family protein [Helicobacter sp. MIT 14-3879]RDU64719.1 3-deoxy-D-manno-octulosonate 8-phosphate phosphatase [Helicobacter sp. MIT 14-3879]